MDRQWMAESAWRVWYGWKCEVVEHGLPVDACPYSPGPQRTAWVAGWWIAAPRKEPANAE